MDIEAIGATLCSILLQQTLIFSTSNESNTISIQMLPITHDTAVLCFAKHSGHHPVRCIFRCLARPDITEQEVCGFLWRSAVLESHLERVNLPLSSQHTHTHTKHTHSQSLYKPKCCSVPTYCGGYRPKNKFGKLKVCQRLFPTDVLKLFQSCKDLCPALLSLTDLPSGLSSVCHIQRNAAAASISESKITAGPPVVCLEKFLLFFFFFTAPTVKIEVNLRSGWVLIKILYSHLDLKWWPSRVEVQS